MTTPLWVYELAGAFWKGAVPRGLRNGHGGTERRIPEGRTERRVPEESFPRNLRRPIALALPVSVVSLPALRVAGVDRWLIEQGAPSCIEVADRPLRACLVARYGHGIIFLDGTDPEDEQRFSLAHEVAHFLRDYWQPRRLACGRFGSQVLAVLDGDRPARQEERVHSLLARVPIGVYVHLMERTEDGRIAAGAIDAVERDADLLAFELLAPAEEVLRDAAKFPAERRRQRVRRLLSDAYGLPAEPAARYAALLVPQRRERESFVRQLGLVP